MSRIGKQPVELLAGVTAELKENILTIKGPKGELKRELHPGISVKVEEKAVIVERPDDSKESKSLHGLFRSLIFNMVEGVTKGFEKKLEIVGVGYRAQAAKRKITLTLGFSHPVEYLAPEGIEIAMDPENKSMIIVTGIDKQVVGEVAAKIRSFKKPEPYKGKGIKYIDEYIARKSGKAAGAA